MNVQVFYVIISYLLYAIWLFLLLSSNFMQIFIEFNYEYYLSFVEMESSSTKRQCSRRQGKGKTLAYYSVLDTTVPGIEDVLNHPHYFYNRD